MNKDNKKRLYEIESGLSYRFKVFIGEDNERIDAGRIVLDTDLGVLYAYREKELVGIFNWDNIKGVIRKYVDI